MVMAEALTLHCAALLVVFSLLPGSAAAQSFYGGGIVAGDAGSRGAFDSLANFPAAGGFVGLRVRPEWSFELHVDRGFGRSATREQLDAFGRSTMRDRAGNGYALLATWKTRHGRRLGAAVTMGMAMRRFRTERLTFANSDPNDPTPVRLGTSFEDAGIGLSGGVLIPIRLVGRWSLAPEARATIGASRESGRYAQFYPAMRLMWGF